MIAYYYPSKRRYVVVFYISLILLILIAVVLWWRSGIKGIIEFFLLCIYAGVIFFIETFFRGKIPFVLEISIIIIILVVCFSFISPKVLGGVGKLIEKRKRINK